MIPDRPETSLLPTREQVVPLEAARAAAEAELHGLLRAVLLGGRYAILAAEVVSVLLRWNRVAASGATAEVAVALLLLYNAAALAILRRAPIRKLPVIPLLAGDVLLVGALVGLTDGLRSPFASLFFLVTLSGAIYYDLRGGLGTAAAAVVVLLALSIPVPGFWTDVVQGEMRTQLIPYLLVHGAVAGFLVGRLKQLHARRLDADGRLHALQSDQQVRRHEAAIARGIQMAALVPPPAHPGFQTAAFFEPAQVVGGDFYSFARDGDRLAIILGDVSGKGIPAALVSTTLCHLVECLKPLRDPAGFLRAVNNDLVKLLPDETFATLVLAILDPDRRSLILYNAGHPPPLLLRDGECRSIRQENLPLGVLPDLEYPCVETSYQEGDLLLFYSDGLIEVRDREGAMLGEDGLAEIALARLHLRPEGFVQQLAAAASAYGPVNDDLTVVAVHAGAATDATLRR